MREVIFKDGRTTLVDADLMFCEQGAVLLYKHRNGVRERVRSYPSMEVKDVREYRGHPAKELAVKLYAAAGRVPYGSRKLCQLAGVEYSDLVIPVLKKLREAGKLRFEEGRWART